MIRKLRVKFVAAAMLSLLAVLAVLMGSVNLINYRSVVSDADAVLALLAENGGSFRLANKEYQLMEFLMTNPHRILSAERMMEKIWGYDSEADISVVWVYISYLRKTLNALKADIQLKATRNAGYSLEEVK